MRANMKDLVGGGLLIAVGLYVLVTATGYRIGTARAMGPGYYPLLVSGLLIALGLLIAVLALRRSHPIPLPQLRPLAAVIGSVLVFALLIKTAGLIPAVAACMMVSAAGRPDWRPGRTAMLGAVLGVLTWLLFSKGLGLTMPALTWPVLIL